METEISKIEHKVTIAGQDLGEFLLKPGNFIQVNFMGGRQRYLFMKVLDNNSKYLTVASVTKGAPRSALNVRGSDLKFVN